MGAYLCHELFYPGWCWRRLNSPYITFILKTNTLLCSKDQKCRKKSITNTCQMQLNQWCKIIPGVCALPFSQQSLLNSGLYFTVPSASAGLSPHGCTVPTVIKRVGLTSALTHMNCISDYLVYGTIYFPFPCQEDGQFNIRLTDCVLRNKGSDRWQVFSTRCRGLEKCHSVNNSHSFLSHPMNSPVSWTFCPIW